MDELEQTITALDKKYNDLMSCEKELEEIEEEIDKQIKEMTKYDILHLIHYLLILFNIFIIKMLTKPTLTDIINNNKLIRKIYKLLAFINTKNY